jgi:hypothetical protein
VSRERGAVYSVSAKWGSCPARVPAHVRKLGMDKTDAQNKLAMAEENWLTLSDEYEMKMSA